ncbi:hypothetical protein HLB44_15810 [Aquincola sp. S2]|uniref:PLxRFG domain-containing protein n=1 Tax=Pseudaquabacterium terrae TaxID=2732868 RepID=A0ABX2EII3_9BURK|nr:hypothetical protein [Aquabacterium terrae]NRF68460.1 hypothetical protein [Aquabacterium terrae]
MEYRLYKEDKAKVLDQASVTRIVSSSKGSTDSADGIRPVIDPHTGRVDREAMTVLLQSMKEMLPTAKTLKRNANRSDTKQPGDTPASADSMSSTPPERDSETGSLPRLELDSKASTPPPPEADLNGSTSPPEADLNGSTPPKLDAKAAAKAAKAAEKADLKAGGPWKHQREALETLMGDLDKLLALVASPSLMAADILLNKTPGSTPPERDSQTGSPPPLEFDSKASTPPLVDEKAAAKAAKAAEKAAKAYAENPKAAVAAEQAKLLIALRHGFAKAAESADKACWALRGAAAGPLYWVTVPPWFREGEIFRDLGKTLKEVKRQLVGAAATHLQDDYAHKEVKNVEGVAQGFASKRSGAGVVTSTGFTLGGSTHGVAITASGVRTNTMAGDDDTDTDLIVTKDVGGKAKFLGMVSVKAGGIVGDYYEHGDPKEVVKMRVNREANKSLFNKLIPPSAGPKALKARKAVQTLQRAVGKLLGRPYTPEPGAPTFLTKAKLEKGYNTTHLHVLAASLDEKLNTGTQWTQLLDGSFPRGATSAEQAMHAKKDLPIRSPLDLSNPVSEPAGRTEFPVRQAYIEVTAETPRLTGIGKWGGNLKQDLGAQGGVKYSFASYHLRHAAASYEMLDPSQHKDPRDPMRIYTDVDAQLDDAPGHMKPPVAHLYAALRHEFSGKTTTKPGMKIPPPPGLKAALDAQSHFYGNAVPAQLQATIARPSMEKVHLVGAACLGLAELAITLGKEGPCLATKGEDLPEHAQQSLRKWQEESFWNLNKLIWGGNYQGFLEEVLEQPEEFLAQSFDAIGLALGLSSAHLWVLNRQMELKGIPDHHDRRLLANANAAFNYAHGIMDKNCYLPYDRDTLVRSDASIIDRTVAKKHTLGFKANMTGGAKLNAAEGVAQEAGGTMKPMSFVGSGLAAGIGVQVELMNATTHSNPCRIGQYMQWKFPLKGDPLTGAALFAVVKQAVQAAYPGTKVETLQPQLEDVARQVQSMAIPATAGLNLVIKIRRPPGTEGCRLQYWKLLSNKNLDLDISFPKIPLGTGLSAGLQVTDAATSHAWEVMGTDLGYALMQHPKLTGALELEKTLPQLFDASPDLLAKYFGNPDLITGAIDQHLAPGGGGEGPADAARTQAVNAKLDGVTWEATKAEIQALKTPEQRMAYFTNPAKGRAVLDAYVELVRETAVPEDAKGKGPAKATDHSQLTSLMAQEKSLQQVFAENPFLRTQYFGNGATIPALIDDYLAFRDATADGGAALPAKGKLENEFFRYFATDTLKRYAEVANETMHYKPGKVLEPIVRGGPPRSLARDAQAVGEMFSKTTALDNAGGRLNRASPPPADVIDWAKVKAEIKKLETPEQRVAYFEDPKRGRPVFDAFVKLISVTRDVNRFSAARVKTAENAKTGEGWRTLVRPGAFRHAQYKMPTQIKPFGTLPAEGTLASALRNPKKIIEGITPSVRPNPAGAEDAVESVLKLMVRLEQGSPSTGGFQAPTDTLEVPSFFPEEKETDSLISDPEEDFAQLVRDLELEGVVAARNEGEDAAEATVISLIQHATTKYELDHMEEAKVFLDDAELGLTEGELTDDKIKDLVDRINEKYKRNLAVFMVTARRGGAPIVVPPANADDKGAEPVALLIGDDFCGALTTVLQKSGSPPRRASPTGEPGSDEFPDDPPADATYDDILQARRDLADQPIEEADEAARAAKMERLRLRAAKLDPGEGPS